MLQFEGQETPLVGIMLVGWLPVVFVMFALMRPRRAVLVSFLFAWLFLPIASYDLPLIPDYNKMTATCISVVAGVLVFDLQRLLQFRLKWFDLPTVIFCIVTPIMSSLTNGLGVYDGLSSSLDFVFFWGIPYFIGRFYFSDPKGLRELAIGIFIGGLVYVPLCLYEIRMSPQLHHMAYGYHQHAFMQTVRGDGTWRPMVFMQHGLMVGMWMITAALVGVWLWQTGGLKRVLGVPVAVFVVPLMGTALLVRSIGATILFVVGLAVLMLTKWFRTLWIMLGIQGILVLYLFVRVTGIWDGAGLVDLAEQTVGPARAASLETRIDSDRILSAKAWDRPLFGWGHWGRNRAFDEETGARAIADSLWVIIFGSHGLVGLVPMFLIILLPPILFTRRFPVSLWIHPMTSPALVLSLVLVLWMIDNTLNAMINPIFLVIAGGLNGLHASPGTMPNSLRVASPPPV
ncbi:MAG: O-antigen ligase domain-containing protein [Candidatus Hydrogenedentes bacterium]|nr:O-antigen ligase domain-containing protein [Candidatus Hydrogenedentota bacterium]